MREFGTRMLSRAPWWVVAGNILSEVTPLSGRAEPQWVLAGGLGGSVRVSGSGSPERTEWRHAGPLGCCQLRPVSGRLNSASSLDDQVCFRSPGALWAAMSGAGSEPSPGPRVAPSARRSIPAESAAAAGLGRGWLG